MGTRRPRWVLPARQVPAFLRTARQVPVAYCVSAPAIRITIAQPPNPAKLMPQRTLFVVFGSLLLVAIALMVWTGDWFAPDAIRCEQTSTANEIVDRGPLQTAQLLAPLATTLKEQALAREALHTADQDVDLAFEAALRDAIEHPPALTPEARKIEAQITDLESRVKTGQSRVAVLDKQVQAATESSKEDAGNHTLLGTYLRRDLNLVGREPFG